MQNPNIHKISAKVAARNIIVINIKSELSRTGNVCLEHINTYRCQICLKI